jgi:hypothetical protein
LAVVLNTFDAQPLSEEEGEANSLEEEAATFNIKYLTSSKLMGLEVSMLWLDMRTSELSSSLTFFSTFRHS